MEEGRGGVGEVPCHAGSGSGQGLSTQRKSGYASKPEPDGMTTAAILVFSSVPRIQSWLSASG